MSRINQTLTFTCSILARAEMSVCLIYHFSCIDIRTTSLTKLVSYFSQLYLIYYAFPNFTDIYLYLEIILKPAECIYGASFLSAHGLLYTGLATGAYMWGHGPT